MKTSKQIGRQSLLKYCLISLAVILTIPIAIGLSYQVFTQEPISIKTFFVNLFNDIKGNQIFLLVQVLLILTAIWLIGGFAGQLIIDKNYPKKVIGFFTFFALWIFLFLSCALTSGLMRFQTWGIDGIKSSTIGWLAYGLFLFLIAGIINGLTIGFLYGNELKEKKTTR